MTPQPSSRILRRLGEPGVWSLPLILFSAPFYAVLTFAFDAVRLASIDQVWLWLGLITYFELVGITWVFVNALPASAWKTKYPYLVNFALAFILGGLKNLSVAILATQLHAEENINWFARFIGGGFLGLGVLVFFVMTLGTRIEHRAVMHELNLSRQRLERLRHEAPAMVATQQVLLVEETKASILPELEKIKKLLRNEVKALAAVEMLREVIQNQVRPLSQTFHSRAKALSNVEITPKTSRTVAGWQLPNSFNLADNLSPVVATAGLVFGIVATSSVLYGQYAAGWALLAGSATYPLMTLFKIVARRCKPASRVRNVTLTVLLALVIATFASLILFAGLRTSSQDMLMLITVYGTSVLVTGGSAYSQVLEKNRQALEVETRAVNQELSREITIFDQQLLQNSKRWSYLLHGSVQPALVAAASRISAAKTIDKKLSSQVQADLKRAEAMIKEPPETQLDLNEEVQKLTENWKNLCQLHFAVSEDARLVLRKDGTAAFCTSEIVKEAISNAYRHGGASQVWTSVHLLDSNSIELTIRNNGKFAKGDASKPGIGKQMFAELTTEFSMRYDPMTKQVILRAILPITNV